jgi:hypothetical protein
MEKLKNFLKPAGKIKIDKVYENTKTGQFTIVLPKKKLKSVPTKVEVSYW